MFYVIYIMINLAGIMLSYLFTGLPGILVYGFGFLVGASFTLEYLNKK